MNRVSCRPLCPIAQSQWNLLYREQYEPGPPEFGSTVTLGFDPRPDDEPHEVLTLREVPKAMIGDGGGIHDPQETRENIGGREVTIVRRGEACITLTWEQEGIVLTLTNPYDPPGHPRYSCDQLEKIVESIR